MSFLSPVGGFAADLSTINIDQHDHKINPVEGFVFCMSTPGQLCAPKDFQEMSRNVLSLGFVKGNVQLMGRVRNDADIERIFKLELANPSLDRVVITITKDDTIKYSEVFGDTRRFGDRAFFHRNFIVPVRLGAGSVATITINIDRQREAVFLPLRIISEDLFHISRAKEYMLLGGLIGMYTIYIIFILALFLLTRSRLFIFYAMLDVFVLLYCLLDTGFGFQFIWSSAPFFQQVIIPFTAFAYLLSIISFAREFFSTKIKYPQLDNLFRFYILLDVVAFLAVIVVYVILGTPLAVPMAVLTILFLLFGATVTLLGVITFFQSGRREGFWFLLLFVLHLVMFAFVLNQKGYLGYFVISPDSALYNHLPLFTSTPHYIFDVLVAEMMIVSAIIAFRFQHVLREYNVTQLKIEVINRESIKAFVKGQEAERNSLAERLHKNIGIDLNGIGHDLTSEGEGFKSSEGLMISIDQLKSVQNDLHRITSDFVINWKEVGLSDLVRKVVAEMKMAIPDLEIVINIDDEMDAVADNDLVMLNIYRILQEACNNVIRHAEAGKVEITIEMKDGGILMILSDDGLGFNTENVITKKGIGLRNMETRARALHGTIVFESDEGKGTLIRLWIPEQNSKLS
ncbi:MAG: hypothetical protein GY751_00805 [Bacteroidetes bacterium]|nr:hypothetical protein [Bacteroidota bacterium]